MIRAALVLGMMLTGAATAGPIGDADRGAALFQRQCSACHQIGPEAINRVGPRLTGLFGRRAGSVEGFDYSKSMARMGSDGLVWTMQTLDAYIENPKVLVSATRMRFRGLQDEQARSDLIAFLREWSDRPRDIPEAEPTARRSTPQLSPEVLAIRGDPEFGAYLSSECSTCHQRDGSDQGIPSITHWPPEDFVLAMHAYRQKLRPHPVMQMMAGRLTEEEIAALAAYYAGID
ncbi:cytochrome c [Cereibacter ovatus]|uniref:Cytochrome c n=1 Tax=Cereibacter ovatus TaxID=439529 RepID=A0A285CVL0_9RHOB|nr:c-type cytochrome [Cereibacter ovatus]SNX71066.1 cytochrome c [Cereibacter ovatus]